MVAQMGPHGTFTEGAGITIGVPQLRSHKMHEMLTIMHSAYCLPSFKPNIFSSVWMPMGTFQHMKHSARLTEDKWNHFAAAVQGYSICLLPWWLKWVPIGNEYHSLHHINSRILGYKLEQCFKNGGSLI